MLLITDLLDLLNVNQNFVYRLVLLYDYNIYSRLIAGPAWF